MKLGFNMAGCEAAFQQHLSSSIDHYGACVEDENEYFLYVEVGIAGCTTLLAATEQIARDATRWLVIGTDLRAGAFFNATEFIRQCRHPFLIADHDLTTVLLNCVMVDLRARKAITDLSGVNFALIDGCHGFICVIDDFLALEPAIAQGGIIAFHDAGTREQGTHHQPHCNQPISVRAALDHLGLVTDPRCRQGWEFLELVEGDANHDGHGMAFFRKL